MNLLRRADYGSNTKKKKRTWTRRGEEKKNIKKKNLERPKTHTKTRHRIPLYQIIVALGLRPPGTEEIEKYKSEC